MNRPIVTVKQGKLQGIRRENVLCSHYYSFRGIPFAAPPIGKLRFQGPKPPASWDGIRDASQEGNISLQLDEATETVIGSEDCLYLNVHVPCTIYGSTGNPVMVWIHGGAYMKGSGTDNDQRHDYLLAKDVIIVSINYRLGALGSLSFDHEVASGNQGLKDQIAALKWVKENIEAFGGNPGNVTVVGHSAGALNIHFLMISPQAKGLFHKAILQSFIITKHFIMKATEMSGTSFKLASLFGNDSKDPEELVEFLQSVPADKFVKIQNKFYSKLDKYRCNVPFIPTLDRNLKNPIFPYLFHQMIHDDNDIPILIGHTSHEYILFLDDQSEKTVNMIYEDLPYHIRKLVNVQDPKELMRMTERTKQWYFNGKPCTGNRVTSLIQCLSDIFIKIPIIEFVNSRRKRKEAVTYCYQFSYMGNQTTYTRLMGSEWRFMGASHGDELSYLFYIPQCKINDPDPPAIGTKDRKMLEALTSMWTNFAKTGNPTAVIDENVTTTWLPATADAFNCLEINSDLRSTRITDYTNIFKMTN